MKNEKSLDDVRSAQVSFSFCIALFDLENRGDYLGEGFMGLFNLRFIESVEVLNT